MQTSVAFELELWEKIKEKAIQGRRTGLGITAEGDMLAALGYRYGTEEAIDFAVKIQKTLALAGLSGFGRDGQRARSIPDLRCRTGEEQPDDSPYQGGRSGTLRRYGSVWTTQYRHPDDRAYGNHQPDVPNHIGYRTRIRPVYTRRRKVNPSDKDVKVTFVDEVGDSWEEYNVFHHKFLVWLEVNGYNVDEVKNMFTSRNRRLGCQITLL